MEKELRLFIAISISQELRKKLKNFIDNLKKIESDVKWVEDKNFHLTLKFLGNVSVNKIEDLKKAIEKTAKKSCQFSVYLKGIGAFPNLRNARVMWTGLNDEKKELGNIAKELDANLEKIGFARENKPFSSHLTLGRVRSGRRVENLLKELEKFIDFDFGEISVKEICLVKSVLSRFGPEYSILKSFPLNN